MKIHSFNSFINENSGHNLGGGTVYDDSVIEVLKEMNINIKTIEYLTQGTMGGVWKSKELPGKIIKVEPLYQTQAKEYLKNYNKIKEFKPKHIVEVFDCAFIPVEEKISYKKFDKYGYFILIKEDLESIYKKLDSTITSLINDMVELQTWEEFKNKEWDKLSTQDLLKTMVVKFYKDGDEFDEVLTEDMVDKLSTSEIQLAHDVYEGLKELRDLGLKGYDIWARNIMYSNKEKIYKLIEII